MKKIIVSAFAAACMVLLSGCSWNMKSNVDTKTDVKPQAENTMMRDNSAMMEKDDAMMKVEVKADSDAMMQK